MLADTAFDSLLYLVEHAGKAVARQALLEAVWPHTTVTDNSVNQAVAAVRRALGDAPSAPRYIATAPGRGYRFVAEVMLQDEAARDPATYQLYVAAWSALTRPTPTNLVQAECDLKDAVARNPGFALALAALAECYVLQATHLVLTAREGYGLARAAAMRALEADPRSAEAWATLGQVQFAFDFDMPTAAASMARALELDPHCFVAYRFLGRQLMVLGRFDEALAAHRRALAIEPLAVSINGNIGFTLYSAGRYQEAIAQLEHALRMDETWVVARGYLGRCHLRLGRLKEAMAAFTHPTSLRSGRPSDLPVAFALSGRIDEARAALAALLPEAASARVPPLEVAMVYAALGDEGRAIDWIERAIDEHDGQAMMVAVDPAFHGLHACPRYRGLLDRLGLGAVLP